MIILIVPLTLLAFLNLVTLIIIFDLVCHPWDDYEDDHDFGGHNFGGHDFGGHEFGGHGDNEEACMPLIPWDHLHHCDSNSLAGDLSSCGSKATSEGE